MTTNQRLDRQMADLQEMSAILPSIRCGIEDLLSERDLLRAENARMQIEIQRLTLKLESAMRPPE